MSFYSRAFRCGPKFLVGSSSTETRGQNPPKSKYCDFFFQVDLERSQVPGGIIPHGIFRSTNGRRPAASEFLCGKPKQQEGRPTWHRPLLFGFNIILRPLWKKRHVTFSFSLTGNQTQGPRRIRYLFSYNQ